jgi:hypothetical protein
VLLEGRPFVELLGGVGDEEGHVAFEGPGIG